MESQIAGTLCYRLTCPCDKDTKSFAYRTCTHGDHFFLSQIADKHNVLISMPCPLPSSAQSIMFIITLLMLTNSKLHWHRYLVSMSNYKIHNVTPSELHKDRSSSIWHNYHTGMMQHLVDNPRTEKVLLVLL